MYGQLGLGHFQSVQVPRPIGTFENIEIIQVSCGSSHAAFLTDEGDLYMSGCGAYGCLGIPASTLGDSNGSNVPGPTGLRGGCASVPQKLAIPLCEDILQLQTKKRAIREKAKPPSQNASEATAGSGEAEQPVKPGEVATALHQTTTQEFLKFGFVACGERHTLAITANWTDYKGRI